MNQIIPASQLAQLLAKATGAEPDAAQRFVKAYFETIHNALAAGDDITVDGLGTFTLTADADQPLIFIADAKLAEAVNAPFADFEPMPLEDGELIDNQPQPAPEPQPAPTPAPQPAPAPEDVTPPELPKPPQMPKPQSPAASPQMPAPAPAPRGGNRWPAIIGAFILGLIIGICLGYLPGRIQPPQKPTVQPIVVEEDIDDPETLPLNTDTVAKDTTAKTSEAAQQPAREPRYDTLSANTFLATLARKYYGQTDYWVYIYDANPGLGNPNRIAPGTKVLVPYADELPLTGDLEADKTAARRRAAKIFEPYQ